MLDPMKSVFLQVDVDAYDRCRGVESPAEPREPEPDVAILQLQLVGISECRQMQRKVIFV